MTKIKPFAVGAALTAAALMPAAAQAASGWR